MIENFEELEAEIHDCKKCKLCNNRHNIVIGDGNKEAKLMFIGEGPGADEDIQGIPFVGKAGQLMNQAFRLAWCRGNCKLKWGVDSFSLVN